MGKALTTTATPFQSGLYCGATIKSNLERKGFVSSSGEAGAES